MFVLQEENLKLSRKCQAKERELMRKEQSMKALESALQRAQEFAASKSSFMSFY